MAQDFLALAQIQIAADAALFRAELAKVIAETRAVKPVVIPITAQVGTTAAKTAQQAAAANTKVAQTATGAAAANTKVAKSATAAAVATQRSAAASSRSAAVSAGAAEAQRLLASATNLVAVAERRAVASTTEVGAAQIRYSASIRATATTFKAYQASLETTDFLLIKQTRDTYAAAKANEALALTSLEAARAQKSQAAAAAESSAITATRAREAAKGLQAQALSFVGLRGAIIGANPAFLAATAGAILFAKSIQSAVSFQTELNVFQATAGATAEEMGRVGEAAKQLGQDVTLPAVTTADAAEAMTELSKAGLSVQDSIAGARGVLQLATAAAIDNAKATEIAASALNAFGLSGAEATHVADVLANAANSSQGSIEDIGIALAQSSAVARQAGLSLEQTTAVLTLFARAGLRGSDAGTSFRTMLLRLINPTQKAQEVIDRLGLNLRTATGAINLGIFDQFSAATRSFTRAQRDQAAAVIFGSDAIRGFLIGVRAGNVELSKQIDVNNRAGAASDLAAARTKGLAGAAENLKNQLSNAALEIGTSMIPGLTDLINLMADSVTGAHDLVVEVGKLAQQATKPIDIVVNVIRKVTGDTGGGGPSREDAAGLAKRLFSVRETVPGFLRDLGQLGIEGAAALQAGLNVKLVKFPTLDEARAQIHDLIAELNKTPGPTQLNKTVVALIAIRDAMAKGTFGTKEFAKSLTPFIAQLQNLSGLDITLPEIKFPVKLEAGAKANLQSSANDASSTFGATFLPTMEEIGKQAMQAVSKGTLDPGAKAAIAAAAKVAAAAASQAAAAASAELDVEFRGGSDQQRRAALVRERAAEDRRVTALEKQGAAQKDIDAAKQAAIATQAKIDAIDEAARQAAKQAESARQQKARKDAADRKRRAEKARDERAKADQAVLDAFIPKQNRLDLRAIQVAQNATLKDDLALQVAIANEASREIAIIDKTVKVKKTRDAEIAARIKILAQAGSDITGLVKQIATNAKTRAAAARQAITDLLGQRLELAQLRVGPEGQGKDAVLAAFDRAIADAHKRVAATKKLSAARVKEEIALQTLINDRKEFLKSLKKDVSDLKQVSAFDLLKQSAEIFNQNAGNLINGQQPFVGPSGFSADIAQFLIRRPAGSQNLGSPQQVKLSDDLLIKALDRLTDTLQKTGNGSTATRGGSAPGVGNQWSTRRWFMDASNAQSWQEG